jgi:hypothetical protein
MMKSGARSDRGGDVRRLARRVESKLERLLGIQQSGELEPLEIAALIVRDVEGHVEPTGRGRRRLPFTRAEVVLLAPTRTSQDRIAAALEDLDEKIRVRLRELDCELTGRFAVELRYARKPRKGWAADQRYELLLSREPADAAPPADVPPVRIVVLSGAATRRSYTFRQKTICLGRTSDPGGPAGRSRRNDVVFLDNQDEIASSVARAQAHIAYDPARREFRVFDDGSRNGTRVLRTGEVIPVKPENPRGVRLVPGDEIQAGRALVRFECEG